MYHAMFTDPPEHLTLFTASRYYRDSPPPPPFAPVLTLS